MPTLGEYLLTVIAAAGPGANRTYGTYWNRMATTWGHCRLDELLASDIEAMKNTAAKTARSRRSSRHGRHAGEHVGGGVDAHERPVSPAVGGSIVDELSSHDVCSHSPKRRGIRRPSRHRPDLACAPPAHGLTARGIPASTVLTACSGLIMRTLEMMLRDATPLDSAEVPPIADEHDEVIWSGGVSTPATGQSQGGFTRGRRTDPAAVPGQERGCGHRTRPGAP
jgi:hypothetical protein